MIVQSSRLDIAASRIQNPHLNRIHDFYEKLVVRVQALDTINKQKKKISGYVMLALDKLPGMRADLVRIDEDW